MNKCNDFNELQLYNIWAKWNQKGGKYEEKNDKIMWDTLALNSYFNRKRLEGDSPISVYMSGCFEGPSFQSDRSQSSGAF